MFIGSYKGCMESPKYKKGGNKITTYSVYKMDVKTTKASHFSSFSYIPFSCM